MTPNHETRCNMHTFMVPCLLGLEKLVGDESRRLGLKDVQVENGRVL